MKVFIQPGASLKQEEQDTILNKQLWDSFLRVFLVRMRQLKGKPKKETSRDKKERKQAMQEARQQITTVVLPTLAVVVALIVVFVYVATRPATTE
ncbi:single-pass membrane and coiled-coil domain-containing protein 4 isoform X2 [Notamacropus eugenii]|uniref:single-pass membrane and coiled-coil domain-containing protein 4 isoform X2 n=1 Tax=Notamacropus eugenii TaxID=9315 RepID=UPI003B67876A